MEPYIEELSSILVRIEKLIEAMRAGGGQAREGGSDSHESDAESIDTDISDGESANLADLNRRIHEFTDWLHMFNDITRAVNGRMCAQININNIRLRTQKQFTVLYRLAEDVGWSRSHFEEALGTYFIMEGTYVDQWRTLYNRLWISWINGLGNSG